MSDVADEEDGEEVEEESRMVIRSLTREIEELRAKRLSNQSISEAAAKAEEDDEAEEEELLVAGKEQKKDEQEDDNIGFEPDFFSETILGELGSSSPPQKNGIKVSKLSDQDQNQMPVDCDSGSSDPTAIVDS